MKKKLFKITYDEYFHYLNKSKTEIKLFIRNKLPYDIVYGYGYFGGRLVEIERKFYIEIVCDKDFT